MEHFELQLITGEVENFLGAQVEAPESKAEAEDALQEALRGWLGIHEDVR